MSYNKDFYKNYEKYLKEDTVRRVHDSMFDVFEGVFNKTSPALDLNVVDFGCGLCEFFYFGVYTNYLGIEKNFARDETVVLDDYLTISKDNLIRKAKPKMKNITAFISLFSTECCLTIEEKYKFYRKIFKDYESIKIALVSGFYYKGKKKDEVVITAA